MPDRLIGLNAIQSLLEMSPTRLVLSAPAWSTTRMPDWLLKYSACLCLGCRIACPWPVSGAAPPAPPLSVYRAFST